MSTDHLFLLKDENNECDLQNEKLGGEKKEKQRAIRSQWLLWILFFKYFCTKFPVVCRDLEEKWQVDKM